MPLPAQFSGERSGERPAAAPEDPFESATASVEVVSPDKTLKVRFEDANAVVLICTQTLREAEATFKDAHFKGVVSRGQVVDLRLETEFDYKDGCTWRAIHTIEGMLSGGGLTYAYSEARRAGTSPRCGRSA